MDTRLRGYDTMGVIIPVNAGFMRNEKYLHAYEIKRIQLKVIPANAGIHSKMNQYYVYILASKKNGTLYIGVTNNLVRRVYEHKESLIDGFTKKYNVKKLVYYETHHEVNEAIKREKAMKKWLRKWKIELIETLNPEWKDLYEEII